MLEMKHKDIRNGLCVLRDTGILIFQKLMNERKPLTVESDIFSFPEEIHDIKDAIRLIASAHGLHGGIDESEIYKLYIGISDLIRGVPNTRPAPGKEEFHRMLSVLFSASVKLNNSSERRVVYRAFQHVIDHYPFSSQSENGMENE